MRSLAALVVATLISAAAPPASATSWQPGDVVVDGWILSAQERHPEYLRLTLSRGDERARAEVTFSQGPDDAWSTDLYRVQPAPGGKLPAALAQALRQRLAEIEREPGHLPWVGDAKAAASAGAGPAAATSSYSAPYPPPRRWALLALLAVALALTLACLATLEGRRDLWAGVGASMAVGLAIRLALPPDAVPIDWLTVLHEGSVERLVATLHGNGNHGPLVDTVRWAFAPGAAVPLRGVVALQIALGAANSIGFLVLARALLGHWPLALLMTAGFSLNPLRVNGLLSELPSELLTTLALMGCAGIAALPARRWLGVLTLAVVTAGMAVVRPETAAVGATALLTALVPRWGRAWGLVAVAGATAAWALMPWLSPFRLEGPGLEVLTLPIALLTALPVGIVALTLLGCLQAARDPGRFTLAALALFPVYRVYWAAAHHGEAPWEVLRYLTFIAPVVMLVALVGWRALLDRTPERWRRLVVILVAATCALPPPDALARALMPARHTASADRLVAMPLTRLQQAEARSLARALDAHPECLIVTTSARDPRRSAPIEAWDWVLFGGGLAQHLAAPRDPPALEATVDAALPGVPCVLFHRGIDCHVVGGPRCAEEVAGGVLLRSETWIRRPYYDHLERRPEVQLELYRLRPARTPAQPQRDSVPKDGAPTHGARPDPTE